MSLEGELQCVNDHNELTRSLCSLLKIKEEPSDEEYKQYFSFSISAEDIKDEPKVAKVGQMIRFVG